MSSKLINMGRFTTYRDVEMGRELLQLLGFEYYQDVDDFIVLIYLFDMEPLIFMV